MDMIKCDEKNIFQGNDDIRATIQKYFKGKHINKSNNNLI